MLRGKGAAGVHDRDMGCGASSAQERRFGPSQLATDACQFKSNQTTLTELAAVALVHLDNLEELERRLGASGAAYLFAYLYAYRLVRWRVEPLDPRRAH